MLSGVWVISISGGLVGREILMVLTPDLYKTLSRPL